jgi:hypothetical protein
MSGAGRPWERREPRSVPAEVAGCAGTASRLAPLPLALALALAAAGCTATVDVNDVCETFERSEAAPVSPDLRRTDDGKLELFVSVTGVAEAKAVVAAARREPVDVMMYPSEMYVHVLRVEGGQLVVSVNSPEHAARAIDALCIKPGDP